MAGVSGPPGQLNALFDPCQFPRETTFRKIDEIDRCILLVAEQHVHKRDPWHENSLHVAVWVDGLLELHSAGRVTGLEPLSERQWEERRRDDLRLALGFRDREPEGPDPLDNLRVRLWNGTFQRVTLPPLPDDEDDEWPAAEPAQIGFSGEPVRVTEGGWTELQEAMSQDLQLGPGLERVRALLDLGFYDTAVREGAVMLESRMRTRLHAAPTLFGEALIRQFMARIGEGGGLTNASEKIMRSCLRTAFRFIRNIVMHNRVDPPRDEALALVLRLAGLIQDVEEVELRNVQPD